MVILLDVEHLLSARELRALVDKVEDAEKV